jgi:hypothetical protein
MFKLGEVKLPCDEDFNYVKGLCMDDEGWIIQYNKTGLKVTKSYSFAYTVKPQFLHT